MQAHRILAGFLQDASKSTISRSCATGNLQKAQLHNRHQESQWLAQQIRTGPPCQTSFKVLSSSAYLLWCFLFLPFPSEIGIRRYYWVEVLQPLLLCEDSYEKEIHGEERVGKARRGWGCDLRQVPPRQQGSSTLWVTISALPPFEVRELALLVNLLTKEMREGRM